MSQMLISSRLSATAQAPDDPIEEVPSRGGMWLCVWGDGGSVQDPSGVQAPVLEK